MSNSSLIKRRFTWIAEKPQLGLYTDEFYKFSAGFPKNLLSTLIHECPEGMDSEIDLTCKKCFRKEFLLEIPRSYFFGKNNAHHF